MARKVAIVGVGLIPWKSRYADKTYYELCMDVTKAALQDARIGARPESTAVFFAEDLAAQ